MTRVALLDHLVARVRALAVTDGIFLHRPELRRRWDLSVFLDVPFTISYARMAARDGSDPDPDAPTNRRYLDGQRRYLRESRPDAHATIVVDHTDLDAPVLVADRTAG